MNLALGTPKKCKGELGGLAIEFAVTRIVRDAAALPDAVNGPGIGDKYELACPARPYMQEVGASPGHLRIAMTTRAWSGVPVEKEHMRAVESVGQELISLGHKTVASSQTPPYLTRLLDPALEHSSQQKCGRSYSISFA